MAPIRQKKDEVVVLAPGTHKGEALNFDHLEDCMVFVFDVTECITIDDCKGCKFYLAPTHGSLFLRDNERCVMYAACKQYRMNNCNHIRSFVHAEGDPALDSCHHLTFGLPGCAMAGYPELMEEAKLKPSKNKALKPHDFSANDEKVPQPRWTIDHPNDHLRMVFQSEEGEAVPDAEEKDFPEEWVGVEENGEKRVIKSRRVLLVNSQGLVQTPKVPSEPKEKKEGGRSKKDQVPRRKHLPPCGTLPLCRARAKRSDGGWQFTVTSDFPVGKTLADYPDVTEESLTIGGGRPRNIHAPASVVTAYEGEISSGDCFEVEYETVQIGDPEEGGKAEESGGRVQAKVIVKVEGAPPPPRKTKRGRSEKEGGEDVGSAEEKPRERRGKKAEAGGAAAKSKSISSEGLSVRHYVDRDFRQLKSCLDAAGRASDTRQVLQAQMQHDPTSIIVAVEGGRNRGRVVGSIYVMFNPWQTTLSNLTVHPDCGENAPAVRRLLVESAEQQCKDRGVEVANVVVPGKDKQGLEFYPSLDWGVNEGDVSMSKRIGKGRK